VDAKQLLKDYKDNELRGDAQYKGKRILLVGKAGEVKRDVTGAIYLTVTSGADTEIPEAQCFFDEEDATGLAAISHGQLVAVTGTVAGLMGNVLVKTCSLSSATALDACDKLRDAGVVAQCVVKWMTVDSVVPFLVSNPPPGLTPSKMSDFERRTTGFVTYTRVYDGDDGGYARTMALGGGQDGGLRFVNIGSPSARIVFSLPSGAADDLRARTKVVVDHLPPASQ
jgi:hypothetical protein